MAVIGGGPAGAAAAITLAQAGIAVALLERSQQDKLAVGEIVPPEVQLPLSALGLWERFCADGHAPSPGILSLWGRPEPRSHDFISSPYGHGWHLDRRRFDGMLVAAAEEAGARVHLGIRLIGCDSQPSGGWRLEALVDRARLVLLADVLIDATGRGPCPVRRLAPKVFYDHLVGIIGFVELPEPEAVSDERMLVEACPDGWWYSARLPDRRLVAAFMTDADQAAAAKRRPRDLWQHRISSAPCTWERARRGNRVNVRAVAANSYRRQRLAGSDWLAVGDAAIALDPLSGQGILSALESGRAGAGAVVTADPRSLARFARQREKDFFEHLRLRATYYGIETRWAGWPFWSRRTGPSRVPEHGLSKTHGQDNQEVHE